MTDSIGWVCPKCSKVYGPHVMECHTCNATAIKHPQKAIPNRLPEPPTWEDRPWVPPPTPYFWFKPSFPAPPWEVTCVPQPWSGSLDAPAMHTSGYMQVVQ